MQNRHRESRPSDAVGIERSQARMLYENAWPSLTATTVASTILAIIMMMSSARLGIVIWWVGMQTVSGARARDFWHWKQIRSRIADFDGHADVIRFATGAIAHGIGWTAFPILFFNQLDHTDRMTMSMILSAMASGAVTVLASQLRLAWVFCLVLLVPTSTMFLIQGSGYNVIIGCLGLVFCGILMQSARVANRTMLSAFRLSEANKGLMAEMKDAYIGLERAQLELKHVNASLEARIQSRTVDLQKEISERARYAQELTRVASTDSLTGLRNRASFSESLRSGLEEAAEFGGSVAVLFIDLDKFKEVNDVRGHAAGDKVLLDVARRLESTLPKDAEIGRWGGDEFVVMLPDVSEADEVMNAAALLRESLTLPVDLVPEAVQIDATIGIAIYPQHGGSQDELIRAADVAMYAAKESGRQCVKMFEPTLAEELVRRHLVAQALHAATELGEFNLQFQPIVSIVTGECVAMEALLRWHHPEMGMIAPLDFIPMAERSGDIIAIGRWVLSEACKAAMNWPGANPPAVAVNVSAIQVLGGTLLEDVEDALRASRLPPSRLHIELTESLFAGDHARTSQTLSVLRQKGVRIAIDDFGTGFSSLSYLQHLPIDTVKIDRSFVKSVDTESLAIVKAIISVAGSLGFELIAEGVETGTQIDTLRTLGVTQFQGYLWSKPMPAQEVGQWLAVGPRDAATSDLQALDAAQRAWAVDVSVQAGD